MASVSVGKERRASARLHGAVCVMDIDEEIRARVRAAKAWDKEAKLGDFQIKVTENGYVLINLKTRRAQLIYDEFSELHDLEELLPEYFRFGRKR
jgi:hypothetical protein